MIPQFSGDKRATQYLQEKSDKGKKKLLMKTPWMYVSAISV